MTNEGDKIELERICHIWHDDPVWAVVWSTDCLLCGNRHFAVTGSNVLNFSGGCPVHNTAVYCWGRIMFVNKFLYGEVAEAIAAPEVLDGLADLKRQRQAQRAVQEEAQHLRYLIGKLRGRGEE